MSAIAPGFSLRTKLVALAMVASVASCAMVLGVLAWLDTREALRSAHDGLVETAEILSINTASALVFDDPDAARASLMALRGRTGVLGAGIYKGEREIFATYGIWDDPEPPRVVDGGVLDNTLLVRSAVTVDGKDLGWLYVRADLSPVRAAVRSHIMVAGGVLVVALLFALAISLWAQRRISEPIFKLSDVARRVSLNKDYSLRAAVRGGDEIGELADALNGLLDQIEAHAGELEARVSERTVALTANAERLGDTNRQLELEYERQAAAARLNEAMQGAQTPEALATAVLGTLADQLGAQLGALYLADEEGQELTRVGTHAFTPGASTPSVVPFGEGLVGQAAADGRARWLHDLPADYIHVASGLGSAVPRELLLVPFARQEVVVGVVELAAVEPMPSSAQAFVERMAASLAVVFLAARDRARVVRLLAETRQQSQTLETQRQQLEMANAELQGQQEELRQSNEELEQQTQLTHAAYQRLEAQQEELRQSNEELERQAQELEVRRETLGAQNERLQRVQIELRDKASALEETSRYKSEFLANMSHELRTPLNSVLILSRLLSDNRGGNLTDKEVEYCSTIHKAGQDLLELINDVLDLAKIEAGHMDTSVGEVQVAGLAADLEREFAHVARSRAIGFEIQVEPEICATFQTDAQRLMQILRNLLSNALKFTQEGGVTLAIRRPRPGEAPLEGVGEGVGTLVFSVHDTGIGIPEDRHAQVFGAFQQVDGGTSRRFGGTGLGLAISSSFAALLGGRIDLESRPGEGSTFNLVLPEAGPAGPEARGAVEAATRGAGGAEAEAQPATAGATSGPRTRPPGEAIEDDRGALKPGERTLLIIEDDTSFAKVLLELARDRGYKCVVATDGETGLELARQIQPAGIVLDVGLPGIDGFEVLGRLKGDARTRATPVHFISASDPDPRATALGAVGFLQKPVQPEQILAAFDRIEGHVHRGLRRILIIEDDERLREDIARLLDARDVTIDTAATGAAALERLAEQRYDCAVLDLGLPDMSGLDLLQRLADDPNVVAPPIVVYTGRELTRGEEQSLQRYAQSIVVKGARSPERLIEETRLFLRRVETGPSPKAPDIQGGFDDRRVMVVDDDVRNLYVLAEALEPHGLEVICAEDGVDALARLRETPVDLVLMDMMMPRMDGYEATRAIRADPKLSKLPVIALTAKAMKGDRERCIDAGANEYLTKPVDIDQLLSVLRVWLA